MDIRQSALAGSWYPAHPERLRQDVARYLAHADPPALPGRLWGLLAPHAGLRFSGPVAAWAFACARGLTPRTVVVVAPWHHAPVAPLLTSAHEAYATPLGIVALDCDAIERLEAVLVARFGIGMQRCRNDAEHAIEIELPFLQCVLGTFRLLPVMMGTAPPAMAQALGIALADSIRSQSVLFVASSDLSHYQSDGVARRLDAAFLERVAAFDPDAVLAAEAEGAGSACGSGAIAAVLWACRALGADQVSLIRHGTSGDVAHDAPWVVGYGAAAIWQAWRAGAS